MYSILAGFLSFKTIIIQKVSYEKTFNFNVHKNCTLKIHFHLMSALNQPLLASYSSNKRRVSLASNPKYTPRSSIASNDVEFLEIQERVKKDFERTKETSQRLEQALKDQNIAENEELKTENEKKKQYINELNEQILEVQDRFIWELSFAVKQYLVQQKGCTSMEGIAISHIPVQQILEDADTEDPQSHQWIDWIEKKFIEYA